MNNEQRPKEEVLNEAGEESFPASDPPAWTLGTSKKPSENTQDEMVPVSCKQCGKKLPQSVLKSPEGGDYTAYFCCERCHQQWEDENKS